MKTSENEAKAFRGYLPYFANEPLETIRPAFESARPRRTLSRAFRFLYSQRSSAGISTNGSSTIFPSA